VAVVPEPVGPKVSHVRKTILLVSRSGIRFRHFFWSMDRQNSARN